MNYITGEKLQEMTEHTLLFRSQIWLQMAETQLKNTNCQYTYIEDNIQTLPVHIKNCKSLFVYTHALDLFFNNIFPLIEHPITLMTHNSDFGILEKYRPYLDSDKIVKWFAQNADIQHPKLVPIPIGIANSQWPHGNLALFDKIRNENNSKTNLVYKNFDINTSHCNRCHVEIATSRNGIPMAPRKPIEEFLRDMSKSIFTICPMGSGTDSHRIWEALYLGSIPVVADCPHNRGFRELPMVMISDGQFRNWECVTTRHLEEVYEKTRNVTFDMSKIDLNYWKQQLQG